jgi:glycosyltransferase involved in cell wall biosynthesis
VPARRILNLMLAATPGGLESMALNYAQALVGEGAEVLSVGLSGSWFERATAEAGFAFQALPPASPIDPRQGWRLARVASAFKPDVVLAHGSRGAAVAVPTLKGRVPVAVVMHNFRARKVATRAELIIAVSPAVAADLRARYPDARVTVVENFAPLEIIPPKPAFADPPHIGGLGRLHEEKGFDLLLLAAARLRDERRAFRLTIAGEGPAAGDLAALTAKLGLGAIADFPGWIAPPSRLLGALDLFVCPSRTESFGLVVVEAMAAGAPVVATDIEGPRDILGEGLYGRLAPPEDPGALAEAIALALDDPARTLETARRAQAEAVAPYGVEAGGRRLIAALSPLA